MKMKMISMIWMKIKNFILKLLYSIFCNNKTKSMKVQFYKNIDMVQINVKKGISEYFFPTNVDWANQKIDKMVVYGSYIGEGEFSPIDGDTPILSCDRLKELYFDLYNSDNTQIAHSLSGVNMLYTNNFPIEINSKISLSTSKMVFYREPEEDGCFLIYIFWGTKTAESSDIPKNSVTVSFTMGVGEELALSKVIDTYIHSQSKKLRGIYFWDRSSIARAVFLTLRDYNYKTIVRLLPGAFCRPPMGLSPLNEDLSFHEKAQTIQVTPMFIDSADIDFDNSFIYYSSDGEFNDEEIVITFLY